MAGCKSCQRGGNDGTATPMDTAPEMQGSPMEGMSSPEVPPEMGGAPEGFEGSPMEGSPVAMSGGGCGKKHKTGGNLTTHAVPVLLTLAATRKGKSMKNRLSLGVLKGGKKSRKSKGKKSKKVKKSKKAKKSKKTRKSRR